MSQNPKRVENRTGSSLIAIESVENQQGFPSFTKLPCPEDVLEFTKLPWPEFVLEVRALVLEFRMSRKQKRMKSVENQMASSSPPWLELPVDITAAILHKLGALEMMMVAEKVCPLWRSVCRDPLTWRRIHFPDPEEYDVWGTEEDDFDFVKAYMDAIDRSQGHLIDIDIHGLFANELLPYMSRRCSQLKRLQLKHCWHVTSDCLIQTMKGFPLLEEMHMYFIDLDADAEGVKAIGQSCPRLKSFTFDNYYNKLKDITTLDADARAIAKTMPQIRHLSVIGNTMTEEGLQAIFDGCPLIESLDLRQCFNINFGEKIVKLCTQRIKILRRPHDSTHGYRFGRFI